MSECIVCGRAIPEMELVLKSVVCVSPQCQRVAVDSVRYCQSVLAPIPCIPCEPDDERELLAVGGVRS